MSNKSCLQYLKFDFTYSNIFSVLPVHVSISAQIMNFLKLIPL